jgi:threonine/homoserine/homoserine lactone efflux protein
MNLTAFLLFAIASTITPGPNNIMILNSVLHYGVKRTLPFYLGVCFGFPLMLLAIGMGLNTLFNQYPVLHLGLKVVGIVYLLYLAWLIAIHKPSSTSGIQQKPMSVLGGMIFQWLNPKAWIIAIGAVTTYSSLDSGWGNIVLMAVMFLVVTAICLSLWLYLGHASRSFIHSNKAMRLINLSMGILLAISVLPVIMDVLMLSR